VICRSDAEIGHLDLHSLALLVPGMLFRVSVAGKSPWQSTPASSTERDSQLHIWWGGFRGQAYGGLPPAGLARTEDV